MKRLIAFVTLLAFSSGCAHEVVRYPMVPEVETKRPEMAPLPPNPADEPLPEKTPKGDWLYPVEKDEKADDAGILVSEERATRDGMYRVRYKELRSICEADRAQWKAQRDIYEWQVAAARDALKKAEPNWFDKHKGDLGLLGGLVLGITMTVAAGAAITHVK